MTRLLFVELLGGLGDLVIALPAIHALARSHPGAAVSVLTLPPGGELLAHDPLVDDVRIVGPDETASQAVDRVLADGPWDVVVSDTRYEGIGERVAAAAPVTADNLWRSPPPDELIGERFLRLLLADGLVDPAWADPVPRITLTPDELETAERRVRQALGERAGPLAPAATGAGPSFAPRVLLVPEAGMSIKRWGAERFRTLAGELAAGGAAVLVPVAGEPELGRAAVGGVPGAVVLPPLGLREAAAVCTRTDLVIGGDTGLVRVAAAVGTPTVALFGPTWAGRFGLGAGAVDLQSPFDCPERRPENMTEQRCWYSGRCVYEEKASCMEDISVAAVLARARELLALPAEVRA